MDLTDSQKDALSELVNIGYGRAAGALSELTGHRVGVDVPRVTVHPLDEIGPILSATLNSWVTNVNQKFTGPVSGNALMLMNETSAHVLGKLLGAEQPSAGHFDETTKEILREVGNILLTSCLGVFGNLLHIHVKFAVPNLDFEHVTQVMHKAVPPSDQASTHGLLIHTRFTVRDTTLSGYLVIILSLASLDRLVLEIEKWQRANS